MIQDSAFTYGFIAENDYFTNRVAERERLASYFTAGINSILISPRRWGKSSLVKKTAKDVQNKHKNIIFCFIDLFDIRTEQEFYETLTKEIISKTAGKWEEKIERMQQFLGRIMPKISFSPDSMQEFSLSFDWDQLKENSGKVLDLAEEIATKQHLKIIICIDEFQNISHYDEPLSFQKKLRSHWQQHKHVSYCLYGSKRHMMMEVFTSSEMPFYKFGEILFLEKISQRDWISYIQSRFEATNKVISESDATKIAQLVENHPHYVQQLAQQTWFRTHKLCTSEFIDEAFNDIMNQLHLFFLTLNDQLTTMQLQFLSAILDNVENLSAQDVLKKYRLGTSANISRLKQALIQKDILDFVEGFPQFIDPIYKAWLIKHYFKKNIP